MTDTELNEKIATICGWTHMNWDGPVSYGPATHGFKAASYGKPKDRVMLPPGEVLGGAGEPIPDYCNDLNACHEMEESIPAERQLTYLTDLAPGAYTPWLQVTATARQRAEAFLEVMSV